MEFTGERVIPQSAELVPLYEEHLARYYFAGEFVKGQRVLDLGCGTGYGSYYLSQKGARFVLGTDINGEAVQYAGQHYHAANLAYLQHDALNLPLDRSTFDVVVSFEVIEHLQSAATYLTEVSRVMTDTGWFIGSTPNKVTHSPHNDRSLNPFHCREYEPAELETLLRKFFCSVFILGQRPCHGFVIGPVPIDPYKDKSQVELLPQTVSLERKIADSKDLIYIAGKSDWQIERVQKQCYSHYYLGQPASLHVMTQIHHIRRLHEECQNLRDLVKGYEAGKFIQLMKTLNKCWSRINSF
jgi:ubiquinone/menaquinone biosynthesis C-methylase UbiE